MRGHKLLSICLCLCLIPALFAGCTKTMATPDFSQIGAIADLATLKCYYHNVAEHEKGRDSLLGWWHEKMWIEYGGFVKIGINVGKLRMEGPDEDGHIRISIPKAEVLEFDLDESSIAIVPYTGSIFTNISAEDKLEVLGYAQNDMKITAEQNDSLLLQGQVRAKKVIEKYIEKVSAEMDRVYTVEWVAAE